MEIFHLFHKILLLCDGQVSNYSPHVGNCSPYVRKSNLSNWILDSAPWIPDSKCCNPDSLPVELGLRIPIRSGIPDSLSCILDSEAQDSGLHKKNNPWFQIKQAKCSQIPESGFPYIERDCCDQSRIHS